MMQNSSLTRSDRPLSHSQPISASSAVASPYWARVAYPYNIEVKYKMEEN